MSLTSRMAQFQTRLARFGGRTALAVIAIGLLVIALGYNGISGAAVNGIVDLRAQLPYLLSGGVFGLALVITGAAVMITQSAREGHARLEARLEQLISLQQAPPAALVVPQDAEGLFAAGRSSYHVPSCRLVAGRDDTVYVTADEAEQRALTACRVCRPSEAGTAAGF